MGRRAASILVWIVLLAAAGWIVAHTRTTRRTCRHSCPPDRRRLSGRWSRLREVSLTAILIDIAGGEGAARAIVAGPGHPAAREPSLLNGQQWRNAASEIDRRFVFTHRYLLSEQVLGPLHDRGPARCHHGEHRLAGIAGRILARDLLLTDPTGETLQVLGQLSRIRDPRSEFGVWVSNGRGRCWSPGRAPRAATRTVGRLGVIEAEFGRLRASTMPAPAAFGLRVSGQRVAVRAGHHHPEAFACPCSVRS
jgi:hypothetical protein